MKVFYLVDTENVHSVWVKFLQFMNPQDEMLLFYTPNSQGLSYADLDMLKDGNYNFHMIKCFTGRNGLDFQLSSYLGFLIHQNPDAAFHIIANDNGYDAMIRFWQGRNISVKRLTVDAVKKMSSSLEKSALDPQEKQGTSYVETKVDSVISAVKATADFSRMNLVDALPDNETAIHLTDENTRPVINEDQTHTVSEPLTITEDSPITVTNESVEGSEKPSTTETPDTVPKKRGRKPKISADVETNTSDSASIPQSNEHKETKKRGRKPKTEVVEKNKNETSETESEKPVEQTVTEPSVFSKKESPSIAPVIETQADTTEEYKKTELSSGTLEIKTLPQKSGTEKKEPINTRQPQIKNKTKVTQLLKDTLKNCSFKLTAKDYTKILHVLAYECPQRDLRTINNRLIQAFDQQKGSEIYKTLKQAKAITAVYSQI